jgi:uncharacterized protein YfeS
MSEALLATVPVFKTLQQNQISNCSAIEGCGLKQTALAVWGDRIAYARALSSIEITGKIYCPLKIAVQAFALALQTSWPCFRAEAQRCDRGGGMA